MAVETTMSGKKAQSSSSSTSSRSSSTTSTSSQEVECPLCLEVLDLDDRNFYPCTCGYQICRFCWHRIRSEADTLGETSSSSEGSCPACRKPYSEDPANFKPISVEDVQQKLKHQKKKEKEEKKRISKIGGNSEGTSTKRHLGELRVVQKNLVFVVGITQKIADPDLLKKNEYFGRFGKIHKVVVNCVGQTPVTTINPNVAGMTQIQTQPSYGAYITYTKSDDALRAIQSVNNVPFDGKTIKASLGTTKYCSHFMRNQACPKPDCMYLHTCGDPEASFTKEDMQQGKHQEYERRLLDEWSKKQHAQQENNRVATSKINGKKVPVVVKKGQVNGKEAPPRLTNSTPVISTSPEIQTSASPPTVQEIQKQASQSVKERQLSLTPPEERNQLPMTSSDMPPSESQQNQIPPENGASLNSKTEPPMLQPLLRPTELLSLFDAVDASDINNHNPSLAQQNYHHVGIDHRLDDSGPFNPFSDTQSAFESIIQQEIDSSKLLNAHWKTKTTTPPPGFRVMQQQQGSPEFWNATPDEWVDPAIIYLKSSTENSRCHQSNEAIGHFLGNSLLNDIFNGGGLGGGNPALNGHQQMSSAGQGLGGEDRFLHSQQQTNPVVTSSQMFPQQQAPFTSAPTYQQQYPPFFISQFKQTSQNVLPPPPGFTPSAAAAQLGSNNGLPGPPPGMLPQQFRQHNNFFSGATFPF